MVSLICHPCSPTLVVHSLAVDVRVEAGGDLSLVYQLTDDLSLLRLPTSTPPQRQDGLWRHTCFELFVATVVEAADGRLAYWALRHDHEHPDFHREASFVLEVDLAGSRRT